jgi:hypothetical protein
MPNLAGTVLNLATVKQPFHAKTNNRRSSKQQQRCWNRFPLAIEMNIILGSLLAFLSGSLPLSVWIPVGRGYPSSR